MSKQLVRSMNEGKERILVQYVKQGNSFRPAPDINIVPTLEAGVYKVGLDMSGAAYFEKADIVSDSLLRLNNSTVNKLIERFNKFWERSQAFADEGYTHKGGFILSGPPGSGKSCILKMFCEDTTSKGDLVFIVESAYSLPTVLAQLKEVEAKRHVCVVLEDFERFAYNSEHTLLELLDGPNAVSGVFYLATTNFLEQIPPRLRRKGRFDRVTEIGFPNYDDRMEYLKHKFSKKGADEGLLRYLAEKTDGRAFGDLKDLVVSILCLGLSPEEAVHELEEGVMTHEGKDLTEAQLDVMVEKGRTLEGGFTPSPMNEGSEASKVLALLGE